MLLCVAAAVLLAPILIEAVRSLRAWLASSRKDDSPNDRNDRALTASLLLSTEGDAETGQL